MSALKDELQKQLIPVLKRYLAGDVSLLSTQADIRNVLAMFMPLTGADTLNSNLEEVLLKAKRAQSKADKVADELAGFLIDL